MIRSLLCAVGITILFLGVLPGYAQELPQKNAVLFTCVNKGDTVHFVRFSADATKPRPTILYCQGSLPYPLFVTKGADSWTIAMDVFDSAKVLEEYNLVLISMPHTPVVVPSDRLNERSEYVPDRGHPDVYDRGYLRDNYLEKYVERGNVVLDFLRRQDWVDSRRIILLGHSQGAHVAAYLAAGNPDLFALGYFSGNPMGRFAQMVREKRILSNRGVTTPEVAQQQIDRLYAQWSDICRDNTDNSAGDPKRTWKSFSHFYVDKLTALTIPVFVAYGTEDPGAQLCDLLPIYFELAGKNDYKLRPFVGCGHNFEKIDSDGRPDYDQMKWQEAMDEFLKWIKVLYLHK